MRNKSEKDMNLLLDFSTSLVELVDTTLQNNECHARTVAALMSALVCTMVIERYGKTEEAQDELNDLLKDAWESTSVVGDGKE